MVVFTCHGCNETLKKAQVEKHRFRCHRSHSLCCIDCLKDFHGEEFQTHTKCISEDQKYGGQNYVAKENKGEVKQQRWFDTVQQAIDIVSTTNDHKLKRFLDRLRGYPNIPQKEAKFRNFVINCVRERDENLVTRAWAAVASAAADLKKKDAEKVAAQPLKSDTADKEKSDVVVEKPEENDEVERKQNGKDEERSELPEVETNIEIKPKKHKKHKKDKLQENATNVPEPENQTPDAEPPEISCNDASIQKSEEGGDDKPKKNKKRKKDKLDDNELPNIDDCPAALDAQTNLVEDNSVQPEIQLKKNKKRKNRLQENVENHEVIDDEIAQNGVCNGDVLESQANVICAESDETVAIKHKKQKKHKRQVEDDANSCQLPAVEISSKDTREDSSTKCKHDDQTASCENHSVTVENDEVKSKKHKKHKKRQIEEN